MGLIWRTERKPTRTRPALHHRRHPVDLTVVREADTFKTSIQGVSMLARSRTTTHPDARRAGSEPGTTALEYRLLGALIAAIGVVALVGTHLSGSLPGI
jgi:hypothetical protein